MQKAKRWMMPSKQNVVFEEFEFDSTHLKPREIAMQVDFTAISPGTECANYLALDPDVLKPGTWCSYPWQPGYSGMGHVVAVGASVTEFQVGDIVVAPIGHGSHCVLDADSLVVKVPPDAKPELASMLMMVSISMTPLQLMQQDPLPIVGVWGQGMIGNLAAQLLQNAGGRVVGMDPVAERRAIATRCGIRETLDPADPHFAERINEITRGEGFDITVDTTGHAATTVKIPTFTRKRGQMILMTHWRSQPQLDASEMVNTLFWKGITFQGAHASSPGWAPGIHAVTMLRRKWTRLLHQIATGDLQLEPLISHTIKPPRCKEAYEGLCFDRSKWWGVIVDWRDV